jgi:hypothetical protein
MFVRKKTTKSGTVNHYLVENRREGGKVKQKVLAYLGHHETLEEAIRSAEEWLAYCEDQAGKLVHPKVQEWHAERYGRYTAEAKARLKKLKSVSCSAQ